MDTATLDLERELEIACHALDIVSMEAGDSDAEDDVRIPLLEQLLRDSRSRELESCCNAGYMWDAKTQSFTDVPWWWAVKAWLLCRQSELNALLVKLK
eukprot:3322085-Rhodomonas_salina.1